MLQHFFLLKWIAISVSGGRWDPGYFKKCKQKADTVSLAATNIDNFQFERRGRTREMITRSLLMKIKHTHGFRPWARFAHVTIDLIEENRSKNSRFDQRKNKYTHILFDILDFFSSSRKYTLVNALNITLRAKNGEKAHAENKQYFKNKNIFLLMWSKKTFLAYVDLTNM